jgi:GNAT superfamily N-acetyltransferase
MDQSESGIQVDIPTLADGERILGLARGVQLFTAEDVETIRELWTEFVTKGDEKSWYHFFVARQGDEIVGFGCYGRRALTESTWDYYWMGVAQNMQGKGIGKILMGEVKERVKARGGKLLIIETAGKPEFEPTRQFYLRFPGCNLEARIKDFYAEGDDLFIFSIRL